LGFVKAQNPLIERKIFYVYFNFHSTSCNAGFRPGGRGPFVSAKGPKTIDAQSCHIGLGWTQEKIERTNSLRSDKTRQLIRVSTQRAGLQASERTSDLSDFM
jgi:hypothetical protein